MPLQLARLRNAVRLLHRKPITDLESVATGIAEYEAKILEIEKQAEWASPQAAK